MTATQGPGAGAALLAICHAPSSSSASSGRALPFGQAPQGASPSQLYPKKQKAMTDAHRRPWCGVRGHSSGRSHNPVPAERRAAEGRSCAASLGPGSQWKDKPLRAVPESQSLRTKSFSNAALQPLLPFYRGKD